MQWSFKDLFPRLKGFSAEIVCFLKASLHYLDQFQAKRQMFMPQSIPELLCIRKCNMICYVKKKLYENVFIYKCESQIQYRQIIYLNVFICIAQYIEQLLFVIKVILAYILILIQNYIFSHQSTRCLFENISKTNQYCQLCIELIT